MDKIENLTAKELRIGNWVTTPEGELQVSEIGYNQTGQKVKDHYLKFDVLNTGYYIENNGELIIKPIPLTEEWLINIGFDWRNDIEQDASLVLDLPQRMKIVFYKGNANCCSIYQDDNILDFASGRIKYVHQLQNLYFALTEEELKIKQNG